MTRKVIYYVAASLDGFIAGEHDNLDWLPPSGSPSVGDYGYKEFYSSVTAVVMGRRTYEISVQLEGAAPFPDKENIIFTRKASKEFHEHARFVANPAIFMREYVAKAGGDIWLVGGGEIAGLLANEGLVNEIILTQVPVLLGSGTPLFSGLKRRVGYSLKRFTPFPDGLVQTHYAISSQ